MTPERWWVKVMYDTGKIADTVEVVAQPGCTTPAAARHWARSTVARQLKVPLTTLKTEVVDESP